MNGEARSSLSDFGNSSCATIDCCARAALLQEKHSGQIVRSGSCGRGAFLISPLSMENH
jgi:hypothetical protein